MAVKGAVSKKKIADIILAQFSDSFLYNDGKEIRINMVEDGVPVQIKVTLTASKTIVGNESKASSEDSPVEVPTSNMAHDITEPSEEEKQRIINLLDRLGVSSTETD